jgi:hypothetical protein
MIVANDLAADYYSLKVFIVCRQDNLDTGLKNLRWLFGSVC